MNRTKRLLLGVATASAVALAARRFYEESGASNLAGEVVLITGGSRGLGLALAREFASKFCPVAICARNTEELQRAEQDLRARGACVFTYRCDVTQQDQVQEMVRAVLDRFGRIDILVNNAGNIGVGPIDNLRVVDFEKAMDTIFRGTLYTTLEVLPEMIERRSGRIANIVSIGGKVAIPHLLPYDCAKFAVAGFSAALSAELKPRGVAVTAIYPGFMRTGSFVNAEFKGNRTEEAQWFTMGATSPFLAISAKSAARQVLKAIERGDTEKVIGFPAKMLAALQRALPSQVTNLLAVASSTLLPRPVPGSESASGRELWKEMPRGVRAASILGPRAIRKYNQTA